VTVEHFTGKPSMKVMLYALSTCGWCKKTIELLKQQNIEFDYQYVDLLEGKEQDDAMTIMEKFNPRGSFPTLIIDDTRCIVGFNEKEIIGVLRE
jgi:glutaredoxin-like protein NrdH